MMTKEDFYRLARENAKKKITEFCYGIECTTCPFKSPDCVTKAFYELLEENYELKEKLKKVKEKNPIYKLTQFEYDLINSVNEKYNFDTDLSFDEVEILMDMSEKCYFEGIKNRCVLITTILENCEVIGDD